MQEHEKQNAASILKFTSPVLGLAGAVTGLPIFAVAAGGATIWAHLLEGQTGVGMTREFLDAVATQVLELDPKKIEQGMELHARKIENLEQDMGDMGKSLDDLERRQDLSESENAELKSKLEELTEKLKDRGAPTTEFFAILQPAHRAWSQADDERKRGFIINGIRTSFFEDKFRPFRRHLFHILDQLDPFMLDYLAAVANRGNAPTYRELEIGPFKKKTGILQGTEGEYYGEGSERSLSKYAVKRLVVMGLVFNNSGTLIPTELGLLTLDFIGATESEGSQDRECDSSSVEISPAKTPGPQVRS